MNDELIRAAFEHGADELLPPDSLWEKVEHEIALRQAIRVSPWRRSWRRIAVAVVLLLLMGFGFSPQARAVVEKLQVIWSGLVAGKQAVVTHEPASETQNPIVWEQVADMEAAEAKTELTAPVVEVEEAQLQGVSATVTPWKDGWEMRGIMLTYTVNGESGYMSARLATLQSGEWRPIEDRSVQVLGGPPPTGVRTVKKDGIEALCVDVEGSPRLTFCDWRQDGYQVAVGGPDATVVESLIGEVR